MALDQNWFATVYPFGRWLVAGIALLAAVAGLIGTTFLVGRPGMNSANPFPWFGPLDSFPHLRAVRRDPALLLTLSGEAFFYFLSTLLILTINNPGAAELGFSYTLTSTLSVALLAGICGGSLPTFLDGMLRHAEPGRWPLYVWDLLVRKSALNMSTPPLPPQPRMVCSARDTASPNARLSSASTGRNRSATVLSACRCLRS